MTLPDPKRIPPVKAATGPEAGQDWLIGFGNSGIDGNDWVIQTDRIRASQLAEADFPADAKLDAEFIVYLIEAYRNGRVLPVQPDPMPMFPDLN